MDRVSVARKDDIDFPGKGIHTRNFKIDAVATIRVAVIGGRGVLPISGRKTRHRAPQYE